MAESARQLGVEAAPRVAGATSPSATVFVCDSVEEGQRARELRLAAAFEQAAVGMAVLGLDWQWLDVNARLLDLLGYDEAELRAHALHDLVHPAHRLAHQVLARRLSLGKLDTYSLEQRLLRRDGTAVWVDLKAVRARMPDGIEDHIVIVVEEVDERRGMMEALRTTQQHQEALLCNIPDAAWLKAVDGRYLAVNYAFARACGWTRSEIVGRTDRDLWPEEQAARYHEEDWRVLESGQPLVTEECIDVGNGAVRWYETVRAPVRDASGGWIGTVGVRRDITERKQAEEALRRSEEQLGQVVKLEAVGRLAGGIAHDFNNILTAVGGHAALLLEEIPPGDPLRADLEEIKRGVDRAAALTRQLLAFSRKQVLKPRVLDLTSVVAETERMLRRLIGEDIDLRTSAEPGLGHVLADPGQIQQVILNLAVNARDAMPDGGRLSIELANVDVDEEMARRHVPIQPPGRYVRLTVSDTGIGIPHAIQPHIFEPFFTTKEKGKGTGLGLSTVYGIVKQSGGFIWVYSEPGHGATFKFYLPRVDAPAEPAPSPQPEVAASSGAETILLVEDEPAVRDLAQRILRRKGYRVVAATNGREALDLVERHEGPIDLLVTDLVMPQMDGRELAQRLAALRPGLRVLFMSGYTGDTIAQRGVLDPDVAFIEKPFSPDGLARKVREILDSRVTV